MTQELLETMRALRIGRPLVVAIDGPSGSGKSSVSKEVARRLRLAYLDTGAMYRALTWYCLTEGIDPDRYAALSGHPLDEGRIDALVQDGLLSRKPDGRIAATPAGAPVLNALVAELAR